ncbi:flippase [Altericroceibacterium xinjiangense]|uniref:flippase n=1 Tax=Altericroceibacterium xinjiangense TaxID=762261 RepID=UPI000F7D83D0|nr:flippase [Altericroceibacterium xinjiangense]
MPRGRHDLFPPVEPPGAVQPHGPGRFAMAARVLDPVLSFVRGLLGNYRREVANMGWLFFDRFARVFGNFVIGILAARLLGPASFGGISYAQTVIAFLTLVVALGLNGVVIKRLVDHPAEAGRTLLTSFALQFVAMLVVTAATVSLALFAQDDDPYSRIVAIVACGLILRPTETFRYWFEANVNARRAVIADNAAFLISGTAKIAVLYTFRSVEALAWTLVVEQLLGGIGLAIAYATDRSRPGGWKIDLGVAKELLVGAWPLLLSGLAIAIYMRIDQFVIMSMRGATEMGMYAAAVRFSEMFYVLPTILATSFFPRWQAMMRDSGGEHSAAIRTAMYWMVGISAVIAVALTLLAGTAIQFLYGEPYARAVPVLQVHIWTGVFVSIGILGNQWYLSHGLQSWTLLFTVLGAAANFGTNLLLVPALGAVGAAIASLCAQIISTFLADALSAKTRPLFFIKLEALVWPLAVLRRRLYPAAKSEGPAS